MTMVAYLTRTSDYTVTEDTAFPFDTARYLDTSYCTWAGEGNPVVVVRAGWYWIGGNFTTIGGTGTPPDNQNWLASVGRNGLTLADTIIAERHHAKDGTSSDFMGIGSPYYLEANDEIEVYFQNTGSGLTTLKLEYSSASDAPKLFLIALSGTAPTP